MIDGMRIEVRPSDSGGGIPRIFSIPESAEEIVCWGSFAECRPWRRVSIRWIRRLSES